MITTKIYEKDNDMIAVVLEDGQYSNYIPCPEIAAFDAESFLEEARLGFPDAPLYEFDSMIGLSMEAAACAGGAGEHAHCPGRRKNHHISPAHEPGATGIFPDGIGGRSLAGALESSIRRRGRSGGYIEPEIRRFSLCQCIGQWSIFSHVHWHREMA